MGGEEKCEAVFSELRSLMVHCRRMVNRLRRPSITGSPRHFHGLVGRRDSLTPVIRTCRRCGGYGRGMRRDLVVLRRRSSRRVHRLTGRRLGRSGTEVRRLRRRLGVLLLPGSPGSSGGIVIRVHTNTNKSRTTLFTTRICHVCIRCTSDHE